MRIRSGNRGRVAALAAFFGFGLAARLSSSSMKNRENDVLTFGCRVGSPGRRTVANEAAGRMPNPVYKPDEITPAFLLHRPGTGVFPSDADLRRRRFPPQRRYARMIPQRQPAGNASGRFAADAGGPPPARPSNQNRKEERLFAVWAPHRITLPSNEEGRDDPGQAVWLPRRIARLSDSTTSMLSILKVWLPRWIARWTNRRGRSRRPIAGSGVRTG